MIEKIVLRMMFGFTITEAERATVILYGTAEQAETAKKYDNVICQDFNKQEA